MPSISAPNPEPSNVKKVLGYDAKRKISASLRNFESIMTKSLRISTLIFGVFYLALSLGFGIRTHYCHGDLSSIAYISSSLDCLCGDENGEMGCCSTEEIIFQLKEVSLVPELPQLSFDQVATVLPEIKYVCFIPESTSHVVSDLLPGDSGPPRYIKHRSLLFYS